MGFDTQVPAPEAFTAAAAAPRPNLVPGGFWLRFTAAIIDGLIISAVAFPVKILFAVIQVGAQEHEGAQLAAGALSFGVQMVLSIFYFGWFYKNKGATPGKMLLKLRVVNIKDGTNLSWGTTILREIVGKWISTIILMIGFIMAGLRSDKRALHDLIAGTQVLRKVD